MLIHYFKIFFLNLLVLLILLFSIEMSAGLGRILLGKPFLPLFNPWPYWNKNFPPNHPCNEMKTDVLLTFVHSKPELCEVKDGEIIDKEYVVYKYSNRKNPILLTLGGSTTSGFYQHISNGDTWPKYLAELSAEDYYVVNGGVGKYSSLQEFHKFSRDGSRFENLNLVISLNGINDYEKKRIPFISEHQIRMNKNQYWMEFRYNGLLNSYFIMNFMPNVRNFFLYIGSFKKKRLKNNLKEVEENILLKKKIGNADEWEINIKRLNELVKLENAKYLVFLQPTMGISEIQSKAPKNSNDKKLLDKIDKKYSLEIKNLYEELKLRCSKLDYCIDISDSVPPSGNMYNDARHHNSLGNKFLAEEIWRQIKFYLKNN